MSSEFSTDSQDTAGLQLGRRAARGAALLLAGRVTGQLAGFLRIALVTRLLGPEDMGRYGLALALATGAGALVAFGPDRYLIQKDEVEPGDYGAVWTLNLLRGLLLCAAVALVAGPWAASLGDPLLTSVILIVALEPLLAGLSNPGRIAAEREVRFGKITVLQTGSALLGAVLAPLLAWQIGSAEALAWALVAVGGARAAATFALFRVPAWPSLDAARMKAAWKVGRHFLVVSVLSFAMYQADNVMVGYLFDMTAVGIYVVAYQFVQTPVNALFVDAGRAMTSALSRGRALDDSGRGLLERWLSIALPMAGVLALGMACAGPSLVRAIFGDGWSEAGPVTSALSVVFLGRSVSLSVVPYLISSGRFVWISSLKWLEASVFVVCFWLLGERYGLVGAALGGGIGYLVAAALRLGIALSDEAVHWKVLVGGLGRALICGVPGIVLVLWVQRVPAWTDVLRAWAAVLSYGVVSGGLLCFVVRVDLLSIWQGVRADVSGGQR